MSSRNRRLGFRAPLEIFLNQLICDRLYRGLTSNISPAGVCLRAARPLRWEPMKHRVVALEIELPGTGEAIWARGEICHEVVDALGMSRGIRFTAMAKVHERLLRDFCVETRRRHLGSLLAHLAVGNHGPALA